MVPKSIQILSEKNFAQLSSLLWQAGKCSGADCLWNIDQLLSLTLREDIPLSMIRVCDWRNRKRVIKKAK